MKRNSTCRRPPPQAINSEKSPGEILTIDGYCRNDLQILTPRWLLTPGSGYRGGAGRSSAACQVRGLLGETARPAAKPYLTAGFPAPAQLRSARCQHRVRLGDVDLQLRRRLLPSPSADLLLQSLEDEGNDLLRVVGDGKRGILRLGEAVVERRGEARGALGSQLLGQLLWRL